MDVAHDDDAPEGVPLPLDADGLPFWPLVGEYAVCGPLPYDCDRLVPHPPHEWWHSVERLMMACRGVAR